MTMKDVIILAKLSLFFTIGLIIQSSLGLVWGLIILPNLRENIEHIYYNNFFNIPFNYFALSLILGVAIWIGLIVFLSFFISYKFVEHTVGWKDMKEKFPKVFPR